MPLYALGEKMSKKKIEDTITDALSRFKYDILTGGLKKALIFLLVLAVTAGIIALPSYLAYNRVEDLIVEELGKSAEDMAITAASLIEENAASFKELTAVRDYRKDSYDVEYYADMLAVFGKIKNETGVTHIFAEKKISADEIAYNFKQPGQRGFCDRSNRTSSENRTLGL